MAFAVASGRVGSIVLSDATLIDWRISDKAADSPASATTYVTKLMNEYRPTIVAVEEIGLARRKGARTCALITAISAAAEQRDITTIALPRERRHPNKYAEAAALVTRFPELAPWQPPQRCFYDSEPRNTVLFEALSLAVQLLPERLSADET